MHRHPSGPAPSRNGPPALSPDAPSSRRAGLPWSLVLLLLLGLAPAVACGGCASSRVGTEDAAVEAAAAAEASPSTEPTAHPRIVAVRTLDASPELAAALAAVGEDVDRWTEGWRVEVVEDEAAARGAELEILVDLLPLDGGDEGLVAGLPVELSDGAPVLAGRRYPDSGAALALRLPAADGGGGAGDGTAPPRWLMVGKDPRAVARLVAERTFVATGYAVEGWEDGTDYMLRQASWQRRAGSWVDGDGGTRQPADTRDDLAAEERWFAGLRRAGDGPVRLLAPADGNAPRSGNSFQPERLAAELSASVEAMARRLGTVEGTDPASLTSPPLTVAVEVDHPQQIRHTGRVGEAVPGGPADVHLVWQPHDVFAYRHALARVLVQRSGLADGLPPYLLEGAALWLSGDWYGRPYRHWLPPLAAAGMLPTAAELLAAEEPADGSRLLWTPVAAAVLDARPGTTLAAKLAAPSTPAETAAGLAALARLGAGVTPARREDTSLPPFLAGVSLAMLNHLDLGYHAPSVGGAMDALRERVGANAVSLMPFAYQQRPDAPELRFLNRNPGSETDLAMIHAGREARAHALVVLWKPQIWLSGGFWPGDVAMTTDADWTAWWRSYRRFAVHQALLAEWTGADVYSVGVELGRTVDHEDEWRRLIGAIRLFFSGRLTYSANWYGDFEKVGFWDALDYLGMDAYQPLSDSPTASDEDLRAGARRVLDELRAEVAEHGKPVILTELGYAAHDAAWVAPHEEGGTYSETDQARAYRVMLQTLGRPEWLQGVFVWKAFSSDPQRVQGRRSGADRPDFRFLDREAEPVIADYYANP